MTDDSPRDDRETTHGPDAAADRDEVDGQGEPCDRCGGEAVPDRSGPVSVLECGACGNVLGLADAAFDPDAGPAAPVGADEVAATDGELGQLVTLLRAEGAAGDGSGRSIATDRLLLSTGTATLEVTAGDGEVEIRELDRDEG